MLRLLPALLLSAAVCASGDSSPEQDRADFVRYFRDRFPGIELEQYVHGALMLSEDAKAQYDSIMEFPPFQGDIERGRRLWQAPFRNGRTYASCFPNGGRNVAAKYPYFDDKLDRVVTFEMAINRCRRDNAEPELDYGDPGAMGVLTAYARTLSDGSIVDIKVESSGARRSYEEGRALYHRRIGQLNLACASCHVTHAGNYFRDEILSPGLGQTTHFPVFRGGEFLFTLHMRYQRCMEAMRAAPFAAGSEELNNLEYFHSYLSNGLPLKASVYRK